MRPMLNMYELSQQFGRFAANSHI